MSPRFEPIVGRYLNFELLGRPHRLYIEEAGQGIPLLCLHTAGSDGRQYRGLMNDKRITDNYRVIAFDMPWHGKSSPPVGYQNEEYRLTSRDYVQMILEISDALELDKPVVMGCSIGGRIVLYLAHQHAERFRAIIGLESAAHVAPYYDVSWLHRPDVHGGEVSAGVVSGLIAPTAPDSERWETLWHYCRAVPACSRATCISTRSTATSATGWTRSTAAARRSICSPASTTIPAPARARSTWPNAPARRRRS